jgi:hypothetical protein
LWTDAKRLYSTRSNLADKATLPPDDAAAWERVLDAVVGGAPDRHSSPRAWAANAVALAMRGVIAVEMGTLAKIALEAGELWTDAKRLYSTRSNLADNATLPPDDAAAWERVLDAVVGGAPDRHSSPRAWAANAVAQAMRGSWDRTAEDRASLRAAWLKHLRAKWQGAGKVADENDKVRKAGDGDRKDWFFIVFTIQHDDGSVADEWFKRLLHQGKTLGLKRSDEYGTVYLPNDALRSREKASEYMKSDEPVKLGKNSLLTVLEVYDLPERLQIP